MESVYRLIAFAEFSTDEFILYGLVIFVAGVVRGFAGFGLGSVIIAALAFKWGPLALFPICLLLEAAASLITIRGGLKDANFSAVKVVAFFSAIGLPLGLLVNSTVPQDVAKLIALLVIGLLAVTQLLNVQPGYLRSRFAGQISGLFAGIANGLSGGGGMINAIYFLSRGLEPKVIRASLILNLMIMIATASFYYLIFGILSPLSAIRAALGLPLMLAGLALGIWLFRPQLQRHYQRFCLLLILTLAITGLIGFV